MREFFNGWRRKLGCVALVMACLLVSCTVEQEPMPKSASVGVSPPKKGSKEAIVTTPLVNPDDIRVIATMEKYDSNSIKMITEELDANGISAYIEGSLRYSVSVDSDKAAQATRILTESNRIDHEKVRVLGDPH